MPTSTLITNARVVSPGQSIRDDAVLLSGGCITAVGPGAVAAPGCETVDAGGRLLTPGLVDLHTHGIERFNYDNGPDAIRAAARCLAKFGTTTVLPTLVPRHTPDMLPRVAAAAAALASVTGVNMPGLHLEGPFMALPGAGCAVIPGDLGLLKEILAACNGKARVMSLSPDTPNILPVIEQLVAAGVVPFVTHTRATLAQARAAIAAGARHATHLYDVFPTPVQPEPGVSPAGAVEAYLADSAATVDFIADGCHVDPVMIRLAVRAKGFGGVALITDANIGAGLPPGEYPTPWGYPVTVQPGNGARIHKPGQPLHGVLAGSALTMNVGMANLLQWLDLQPAQTWALGTLNPARIAGLPTKGVIQAGADADLVLWNADLTPARTWVRGTQVWPVAASST